jgi:hypothetical protein
MYTNRLEFINSFLIDLNDKREASLCMKKGWQFFEVSWLYTQWVTNMLLTLSAANTQHLQQPTKKCTVLLVCKEPLKMFSGAM